MILGLERERIFILRSETVNGWRVGVFAPGRGIRVSKRRQVAKCKTPGEKRKTRIAIQCWRLVNTSDDLQLLCSNLQNHVPNPLSSPSINDMHLPVICLNHGRIGVFARFDLKVQNTSPSYAIL